MSITRQQEPDSEQAGFTIIELIVAMLIFSIFVAMFLGAVVQLTQGTTRAQVTAETSTGVLNVFQNIDRQVRYADAINRPGTGSGGARYIEFRTPAASSANGVTTCMQWRFLPTEGRIESRSWQDIPGSTPSSWATKLTLAKDLGGADYPFEMLPATSNGSARQRLVLTLDAGTDKAGASISTSFVARNSAITSQSNSDANGDGQSDLPVCLTTGNRP